MKAVILAGGGGTRLWPLSTLKIPKQFQKLVSNKTMLEETLECLDFLKPSDIYLTINKNHLNLVKKLCPKIPLKNIIIEPALRDTASCIGFAASIIEKNHPGEVMSIIYTDYLIKNKKELQKNLKIAEKISKKYHTLNIIEVPAETPNTNYGYVELDNLFQEISGTKIYTLKSFKEKPDKKTAEKFVKSKKFLWNTGIYVWEAKTLLGYYKKLQPSSYKKFEQMMKACDSPKKEKIISTLYPTLEKISIDYAIMEKVNPKNVKIIKSEKLGWSDIGSFEAIFQELATKKDKNISRGNTKLLDCKGCLVYADNDKKIAAIGLKDIIIIDTKDGLLVCKKNQSKKIKEIIGTKCP